ncbi:MAG TPA: phage major capsid protein [Oculatellaceae cyanobacterium]
MAGPFTIQTFDALTNKYYIPKLVDNFFLRSVFLGMLRKSEKTFDGGRSIQQPISYGKSGNAGAWGGGADVLNTTFVDVATQATHPVCYYYASCTIPQTEQWLNAGKAKIIDLLKAQMELAENSLTDTLGKDVFGDGSLNANNKRRVDGLQAIVGNGADPSIGPFGGITRVGASGPQSNPVGNAFWNANVFACNANATVTMWKDTETIDNLTTISIKKMQFMYGFCTQGGERPTHIITSQLAYNAYFNLLTAIQRQMSTDKVGKMGYEDGLEFNGTPVLVDDLLTQGDTNGSGKMYFLNMDHLYWRPLDSCNFKTTEFRSPANQMMLIKFILLMVNLTCDRPNLQGVITGITG